MSFFRPIMGSFVDELLRHEGLGDDCDDPRCGHCEAELSSADVASPRFFKCVECGEFLQCEACCLEHHQRTPLHNIRVRPNLDDVAVEADLHPRNGTATFGSMSAFAASASFINWAMAAFHALSPTTLSG